MADNLIESEKGDINQIKSWFDKQPHLPQKIDDAFVNRFLHCCDYSLEKTKKLIDLFYTVRSQVPEVFSNRDPLDSNITETLEKFDVVAIPETTKNNHQLLLYRMADRNPDNFNYVNTLKTIFMMADIRILTQTTIPDGEIPIFDMEGLTLKHLTKVNLSVMKRYMLYSQEAHPIKLKQIHCTNVPSFLDRCVALVKPFMKSEVANMLNFHQPSSESLFKFIEKDLLPIEFGGTFKNYQNLKRRWIQTMVEHREFFIDPLRWNMNESLRPSNQLSSKQMFGLEGTFRSLDID